MSDIVYVPQSPGTAADNDDVTVDDEVTTLLEANPDRKSALIVVVGSGTLRVTTDGTDPTPMHGKPTSQLAMSGPFCPTGPVLAVSQDGSDVVVNASEVS